MTGAAALPRALAEAIASEGWGVLEGIIEPAALPAWRRRIDAVAGRQEEVFGTDRLARIGDAGIARAPLLHDPTFLALALHPALVGAARALLGAHVVLGLQNAIILAPAQGHGQQRWHRDLVHQDWTASKPLAIGALVVIDDFDATSGATRFLPASHRAERASADPGEQGVAVMAEAGSAILFDAMVLHRAGDNRGERPRRAINHLYQRPVLRPQYDFPAALGPAEQYDGDTRRLLGYDEIVPRDDAEWRERRYRRLGAPE